MINQSLVPIGPITSAGGTFPIDVNTLYPFNNDTAGYADGNIQAYQLTYPSTTPVVLSDALDIVANGTPKDGQNVKIYNLQGFVSLGQTVTIFDNEISFDQPGQIGFWDCTYSSTTDEWTVLFVSTGRAWNFKGFFDASSNPDYPGGSALDFYLVNVPGKVGGSTGRYVFQGDIILLLFASPGGDQTAVGDSGFYFVIAYGGPKVSVEGTGEIGSLASYPGTTGIYANAYGLNAKNRVQKTTVQSGPFIVRKSDADSDPDPFFFQGGAEMVLFTPEVDLKTTGTSTINVPGTARFFVTEVGLIITNAGTVTGQSTNAFGITGTTDKFVGATATSGLSAVGKRAKYTSLSSEDGVTSLVATRSVAGTTSDGNYKGRYYFKGFLVENQ